MLAIAAIFALGAVAGGWVWQAVWTPPAGLAFNHRFFLDDQGLQQEFSGTGTYVLVAAAVGLIGGVLSALLFRRRAVVTLVSVVAAAALAAWLMARTGHALGPPDPARAARDLEDLAPLVADLYVVGRSPYLVLPTTSVAGLVAVFLTWPTSSPVRARDGAPVGRLQD